MRTKRTLRAVQFSQAHKSTFFPKPATSNTPPYAYASPHKGECSPEPVEQSLSTAVLRLARSCLGSRSDGRNSAGTTRTGHRRLEPLTPRGRKKLSLSGHRHP